MSYKKVNVGIVGCGNISGIYLEMGQTFEILNIAAVADLLPERAKAQAEKYHIPRVLSVAEMMADPSIEIILMVILGGPGTLVGPALGAGIIVFLKNFISAYTQRWLLILGTIYIFAILYAPQGLMNVLKDWLKGSQKRTVEEKARES